MEKQVPQQIKQLIVNFLQREASDQDLKNLKAWLEEDDAHRKYFDEINDTYQAAVTTGKFTAEKIDLAWRNVSTRISTEDRGNVRSITTINRSHYNFLRAAAAISTLVMLSYIAWHYFVPSLPNGKQSIVYNASRLNTKVVLPDSTVVWLNTNSTLEYFSDFGVSKREVRLKGEAFFDVRKGKKGFIVKTDDISICVKGTRFNVRAYADEEDIKTTLEEGKVVLQVKGVEDLFTMKPGDQITFNASLKKVTRDTVDPSDFSSWKEERLVFDNTALSDIILKLENRYKVDIVIDKALAEREHLTMTIGQETIDEVLEFIQLSSTLKYRKDKNQIFIYE